MMFKLLLLLLLSIRISGFPSKNQVVRSCNEINQMKMLNFLSKKNDNFHSLKLSSSSSSSSSSTSRNQPIIPSSLPFGCIIATNNNLNDEQLEIIDDILFNTVNQQFQTPVFICGKNDIKLTLNNILIDTTKDNNILLNQRDHEIPNDKLSLSVKNVPIILLSGFDRNDVKTIITSIRNWNGPKSGKFPKIAFALVVQPALSKTLNELLNEILRDFSEDTLKKS